MIMQINGQFVRKSISSTEQDHAISFMNQLRSTFHHELPAELGFRIQREDKPQYKETASFL